MHQAVAWDSTEAISPGILRHMRSAIRKALSWVLGAVVVAIVVALVAEWFIKVAEDKGLFEGAGDQWDQLVGSVTALVLSPYFYGPLIALAGLVAGMWTDELLKRRERLRQAEFGADSEFGAIRIQPTYSMEFQQLSHIQIFFTAHRDFRDVRFFADIRVRSPIKIEGTTAYSLPGAKETPWQRVTILSKPSMSAGEYTHVKFIERKNNEVDADMIFISEDRQSDRRIPCRSVVPCVIQVLCHIGKRQIIMKHYLMLNTPFFPINRWPEFSAHEALAESNDFTL